MDHSLEPMPTDDSQAKKPAGKKHRRLLTRIAPAVCCIVVLVACVLTVYIWQHHKVTTQAATISSLNKSAGKTNKLSLSLKKQVGQLNQQLQSALAAKASDSSSATNSVTTTQSLQPTSSLIITGTKTVATTTYVPNFKPGNGPSSYLEVDFTIYNNSSSTQTYTTDPFGAASPQSNTYIKGVGSTGEVVNPYLSANGGYGYWQATVLPGGSTNGLALFDPASNVIKLQWLPPGGAQPVYVVLPQS